jgi:CheY-like chemotaxis protein
MGKSSPKPKGTAKPKGASPALKPAAASKPKVLTEEDRINQLRREFTSRSFVGAAFSSFLEDNLLDAHPLAGRTWNAYWSLITSQGEDATFARNLLDLTCELLRALNPERASLVLLANLKLLARERDAWPGFVSTRKYVKTVEEAKIRRLELGAMSGLKKAPAPEDENAPVLVAKMLLGKLQVLSRGDFQGGRLGSPARRIHRKYWDFHYVALEPPPFDSAHRNEWGELAGTLLDLEHGPLKIRDAARERHFREIRNNPNVIGRGESLPKDFLKARNSFEGTDEFVGDETARYQWFDEASLQSEDGPRPEGFRASVLAEKKSLRQKNQHIGDEPLPCILGYRTVKEYCDGAISSNVREVEARYGQFRNEVINRLKARLPEPGQRILFVDDEVPLALRGQEMLRELGYAVESTTSAADALAAMRADPGGFDLVITDLKMPGMTGTELAQQLREIRPELPVIGVTDNAADQESAQQGEHGISKWLTKPLDIKSLRRAVREVFAQPTKT